MYNIKYKVSHFQLPQLLPNMLESIQLTKQTTYDMLNNMWPNLGKLFQIAHQAKSN